MAGSYADPTSLWDLSQASSFSQLPDDDFLALLQKQFPSTVVPLPPSTSSVTADGAPATMNPLSLSDSIQADDSTSISVGGTKRKAADSDSDEGPSTKNSKKNGSGPTKRKSTGSGGDDTRLLKRKEQNRAAQRAFRERKEKHVKELEDKVSALENKNEEANTENQNLRDLLSRLQNENMMLKQQQFTFQMKNGSSPSAPQQQATSPIGASPSSSSTTGSTSSANSVQTPFASSPMFTMNGSSTSPFNTPTPPFPTEPSNMDPLEYSSFANLDPNALNLFDDFFAQDTASSKAVDMDIGGFGRPGDDKPFELISVASNPLFSTMPSLFDVRSSDSPQGASHSADSNVLPDFDLNALTSSPSNWQNASNSQQSQPLSGTLDDLFGLPSNPASQVDFSSFNRNQQVNVSPVVHSSVPAGIANVSSPSSPSSHGSGPSLFSASSNHASPASDMSDHTMGDEQVKNHECPKTRNDFEQRMMTDGLSMFSPPPDTSTFPSSIPLQPSTKTDSLPMSIVSCQNGTNLPKTVKSDQNIELLTAWKSMRTDPSYKDVDINTLCSEFSAKAKCDGSKACEDALIKSASDMNGGQLPEVLPTQVNGGLGLHLFQTITANGGQITSIKETDPMKIATSTPHPDGFHAAGFLL